MSRVVLVEDDEAISELLCLNLEGAGHHVLAAQDGVSGLALARTGAPDVVLLDVMLPRMNGIDVCRKVRRSGTTPIIMLTAREERVADVFEAGADACLTKPFSIREVLARISALVQRSSPPGLAAADLPAVDEIGNFVLDRSAWRVTLDGRDVRLARREFELLSYLLGHAGCTHSREELLDNVWGPGFSGDQKTVDVHVCWLRQKFATRAPFDISSVRGLGYRLDRLPVAATHGQLGPDPTG